MAGSARQEELMKERDKGEDLMEKKEGVADKSVALHKTRVSGMHFAAAMVTAGGGWAYGRWERPESPAGRRTSRFGS